MCEIFHVFIDLSLLFVFVEQIIHDLKNKLESFKDYNRNKFELFLQALKKRDFYSSELFLKLSLTFIIFLKNRFS
jgi:ABC-type Zn uptake system ZnuABC Zn-binding protein ZnuA